MAMVAGFAVVATVLVVTRMHGANDAEGVLAARGDSAAAILVSRAGTPPSGVGNLQAVDRQGEPAMILDGNLVRDARLDEYLAAHKKFGGSSGPGAPSGFLRNAAATAGR